MAGPPRRLRIRKLLEGQPSLTFALDPLKTHRQAAALLGAVLVLGTSCENMKEESKPPAPQGKLAGDTNSAKVSIDALPGLARLRQMFSAMAAKPEDAERQPVSPAVRHEGEASVVGVYPIRAPEPCHLIELCITGVTTPFDIGAITQPRAGVRRCLWQVPWLEVLLNAEGTSIRARGSEISKHPELLRGDVRLAFFLHYADLQRPLETPFGNVALTAPTRKPRRLRAVRYEAPD